MPTVIVYEQVIRRWNLNSRECVSKSRRVSFAPIADERYEVDGFEHVSDGRPFPFCRDFPSLADVMIPGRLIRRECRYGVDATGGEKPIHVRLPVDARILEQHPPAPTRIVWGRSPLSCKLGPITSLAAADVLRIAREGLAADNGDTFTIIDSPSPTTIQESPNHASDDTDQACASDGQATRADVDGLRPLDPCPRTGSADETPAAVGTPDPDRDRETDRAAHALGVEPESGDDPRGGSVTPAVWVRRADGSRYDVTAVVRLPDGAQWVGLPDAPAVLTVCGLTVTASCVLPLARAGRYGLALAPESETPSETQVKASTRPEEPPRPTGEGYGREHVLTTPRRGRAKTSAENPRQGLLF